MRIRATVLYINVIVVMFYPFEAWSNYFLLFIPIWITLCTNIAITWWWKGNKPCCHYKNKDRPRILSLALTVILFLALTLIPVLFFFCFIRSKGNCMLVLFQWRICLEKRGSSVVFCCFFIFNSFTKSNGSRRRNIDVRKKIRGQWNRNIKLAVEKKKQFVCPCCYFPFRYYDVFDAIKNFKLCEQAWIKCKVVVIEGTRG